MVNIWRNTIRKVLIVTRLWLKNDNAIAALRNRHIRQGTLLPQSVEPGTPLFRVASDRC